MSHSRTGLPPLDLEPFDPTPLYAAARSPRREKDLPGHGRDRHPALVGIAVAVALALAAVGAVLLG